MMVAWIALLGQQIDVPSRGQSRHGEALQMTRDDVERLPPDAAGRTENGDALRHQLISR